MPMSSVNGQGLFPSMLCHSQADSPVPFGPSSQLGAQHAISLQSTQSQTVGSSDRKQLWFQVSSDSRAPQHRGCSVHPGGGGRKMRVGGVAEAAVEKTHVPGKQAMGPA